MSETLSGNFAADPAAANRLRRSRIAEAIIKQATETTPIRGHSQGLARIAQALMGNVMQNDVTRETAEAQAKSDAEVAGYQASRNAPSLGAVAPASAPMPAVLPPQQMTPSAERMAAAPPVAPLAGGDARALNEQAAARREAILADANLTPEQQQRELARISEARLVANGTPPRPGAFGGARGPWDDGLPAPSGAVNPVVLAAAGDGQPGNVRFPPGSRPAMPPGMPARAGAFAAPPAAAPSGDSDAELRRIQEGLNSTNPRVQQMARNDLAILSARRREAPPTYPIVQTVGPQGEGQYERTPQGLRYVGPIVREPKEPPQTQTREMVVNGVPGIYTVGRDGRPIARVGEPYQAPQQPPQPEAKDRYLRERQDILDRQAQGRATREDMARLGQLEYLLTPPEQVVATPGGGVSFVGGRPLPGAAPAPAGNAMPMGGPMQPAGMQAGPLITSPVQDASGLPPVGARQGVETVSPGGRPVLTIPAPQTPPAGYQRAADQSALEPIPGGPADPRAKPLTNEESRSNMFGQAMMAGDGLIRGLNVPNNATLIAWRNAPEALVNMGISENDQKYFNAVRQFAAGILRKETGAAFGKGELLDVQSRFFPMPGDSPSVIAQKAEARRVAIEAMRAEIPGGFRGAPQTSAPATGGWTVERAR